MQGQLKAILMIAGIVFLAAGGIIWIACCFRPINVKRAQAEIIGEHYSDSVGKIEALVRFEVDGKTEEHWTQPAAVERGEVRQGEQTEILYVRRKVLGIDTWRVYLENDAGRITRQLRGLYFLAGGAMLFAGAVLTFVGVKVF